MDVINAEVVDYIKSEKFFSDLKELYGDRLISLSLWGTEPTLNLKHLTEIFPRLLAEFPIKEITIPTNLLTDPQIIIDFLNSIPKERDFKFNLQVSHDGPHVTNINRRAGAVAKIESNLTTLITAFNTIDLGLRKIRLTFKPTLSRENLSMYPDISLIFEYFNYFDMLVDNLKVLNQNPGVDLNDLGTTCIPSIAVPGEYTIEDGKNFALICKNLQICRSTSKFKHIHGPLNYLVIRIKKILENSKNLFYDPRMLNCSAGFTSMQLGCKSDLHMCSRALFLNHDEYVDSIMELDKEGFDNWDINSITKGFAEYFKNRYTVAVSDQSGIDRVCYVLAQYHAFFKQRLFCNFSMIKEMYLAGQVDDTFKSDDMCFFLACLLSGPFGCQANRIITSGNLSVGCTSLTRLLGNGAFEISLKGAINELRGTEQPAIC